MTPGASRRDLIAGATLIAAGAGKAESYSAFAGVSVAGDGEMLGPGVHRIAASRTITGTLTLAPGAKLDIAPGVTLTVTGDLVAPTEAIFSGGGTVDLTRGRLVAARPEWWGAVPDDPAVDCGPALAACLAAHSAMQLGAGTYWLAQSWIIDRSDRRVWGIGRTKDARATRLVLRTGEGPVVVLGTEHRPASINDYVRGVELRWLELGRASAAAPPAHDDTDVATGLRVRHVLDCRIEAVRAIEQAIGFSISGAVRTQFADCSAFRSLAGDTGRDIFVGYDLDGRDPFIPTGANASLYLVDCAARIGGAPDLSVSAGCRLRGAMSDTFLVRLETTTLAHGILIDGGAARLPSQSRRFGHVDVHIETPVLDQCSVACIAISDLSETAMIEIVSPYGALSEGGRAAMSVGHGGGWIGVSGGQFIGSLATGSTGITVDRANGLALAGTKLLGFTNPVVAKEAGLIELVVAVTGEAPGGGAAIRLEDCHGGYVRARIAGVAGAYAVGVAVDAASERLTVETAGISPSAVGQAVVVENPVRQQADGLRVTIPPSR